MRGPSPVPSAEEPAGSPGAGSPFLPSQTSKPCWGNA